MTAPVLPRHLVVLALFAATGCLPDFPSRSFVEDPNDDSDGDSYTENQGDCDDDNATAFPDADERCDGADNNCDGEIDEDSAVDASAWFLDGDRDGYGSTNFALTACAAPPGYADNDTDCDDTLAYVNPGEAEVCDEGIDNDCNGLIDDNDPGMVGDATWYADADADGYGDADSTLTQCNQPAGYTLTAGDCDDTNRRVFPDAAEYCDEQDNDCDGFVDDDDPEGVVGPATWFRDADSDGFGALLDTAEACAPPSGYIDDNTDCDDAAATTHPDADELCDGSDNDCDGVIDEDDAVDAPTWYADSDADGYGDADRSRNACAAPAFHVADDTDCDDARDAVNPGATELCSTGTVDEDCDGDFNDIGADGCSTFYYDGDADGFGDSSLSACQCTINTTTGYTATIDADCDDATAAINPGALEDCSTTADDDCDGDDNDDGAAGCTYYWHDSDNDGYGDSSLVQCLCVTADPYDATDEGDCDEADDTVNPGEDEVCFDGVDNDCSGDADGGDAVDATTWYLDDDADGYGLTTFSQSACEEPSGYAGDDGDCDDTRDGVNPGVSEDCLTTFDDDCSGSTNDVGADSCTTFYADSDGDGYGVSSDTQCTCEADSSTVYTSRVTEDCDDSDAAVSPGDTETCATSGVDDDCDGFADEEDATGCTDLFYDFDGDGYGTDDFACLCSASGYYSAATLGDCDDLDSTVSPAAANCGLNGTVDEAAASAIVSPLRVLAVGDLNGDGTPDIAASDYDESTTYYKGGAAYVFLGPVSGSLDASPSGTADVELEGGGPNALVGFEAIFEDIDGDGSDELILEDRSSGVYELLVADASLIGAGRTAVSTSSLLSTGLISYGPQAIGDINGDGFGDIYNRWFIHYGSVSGLGATGDSFPQPRQNLARCDANGDGSGDLITHLNSGSTTTAALYEGGTTWDTTEDFSHPAGGSSSPLACADVTGDGLADLVRSSASASGALDPYTGTYMSYAGRVAVYEGDTSSSNWLSIGTSTKLAFQSHVGGWDWIMVGENASGELGTDIAAGDLDADGIADLVISTGDSTGAVVVYGPISTSGSTVYQSSGDAFVGTTNPAVVWGGDNDGDGHGDFWLFDATGTGSSTATARLFQGTP